MFVIPSLEQGGAERVMSELINEFSRRGHDVTLVLLAKSESFYEINDDVEVINLGFSNTGKFQKLISELSVFIKLRKTFKRKRPAAILSFMVKYNILTLCSGRFLGLNIFVSDRSNPKKVLPKGLEFMRRQTYPWAAGVVAQTQLAKSVLGGAIPNQKNIRVIPNPLKRMSINHKATEPKIVLNVGRLVPEKGQEYLIKSFAKVNHEGWQLVILGDGELRESLTQLISDLGLENKVFLPGAVKEVDDWLSQASVFAFSSVSEGFPNALIEAMSAGLPCISFDCEAGPSDIIEDGENGFLVPVRDVDAFSKTMQNLMSDAQLRRKVGVNAQKVNQKYSLESISEEYFRFFNIN